MDNKYLKTQNKYYCNGCTACSLICPKGAISIEEDSEGFLYPIVDKEKCINCGKCLKFCSNYNTQNIGKRYIAYAAINKNNNILKNSTSGGIFYALCECAFKKENTVIYGAKYNELFEVVHDRALNIKDARKFMGSKYVRSNILGIYEKVKENLDEKMFVVFTGTPCECFGLVTYLNRKYENLLLVDFVCHSNPSPKVFKKYLSGLEIKNNSKIKEYRFRAKDNGWKNPTPIITLKNGTKIEESTFMKAFSRGLISRPSCYKCKFTEPMNVSDITICDFWGVEKLAPFVENIENGVSLLFINNEKAKKFIQNLDNVNLFKLENLSELLKYNHNTQIKENRNRNKFFLKIDEVQDKDFLKHLEKYSKERLLRRIFKRR